MLRKSLLAISLAAAVGTVHAATTPTKIDPNGAGVVPTKDFIQTISSQAGLSVVELKDIDITITDVASVVTNYGTLAKVTISFDGATLSASSNATLAHATPANLSTTVKYPDSKTIEFTVTSSTIAAGDVLTLSGVDLALAGSNITMNVSATSSVAAVEIDSAAGVVAAFVDEYSAKAKTKLDGVIDVATSRKKFTGAGVADVATVTVTDLATDHGDTSASLGAGDVVLTLKGDFSFADTSGDGKLTVADKVTITGTGAVTAATGLQSVSQKAASGGDYSFTITTDGSVVLPAQSYTADVTVAYTNSLGAVGSDATSAIAMGSWTLNGDSDDIAFMPFGSQYANSITVTNMSALAGEITVTLTSGGKSVTAEVGVAAAKSVTQIGSAVAALAAANGMKEANVNVTVNATNTTVVGVYYSKADGDRVLTK
jgi:hypothetical protein